MQHGEVNSPLYVKFVTASLEQGLNYFLDAAFFPEPPKNQLWPNPQNRDSLSLSGGMRIDNGEVFAMTQSRPYQRLEPPAGLEFIESAQKLTKQRRMNGFKKRPLFPPRLADL